MTALLDEFKITYRTIDDVPTCLESLCDAIWATTAEPIELVIAYEGFAENRILHSASLDGETLPDEVAAVLWGRYESWIE